MKHLKKFEYWSQGHPINSEEEVEYVTPYTSEEEEEMEVEDEFSDYELEDNSTMSDDEQVGRIDSFKNYQKNEDNCPSHRNKDCGCGGRKTLESKKDKGVSYEKSGLKHPEKADRNKDKKISRWEGKVGKEIQKSMEKEKVKKNSDESKDKNKKTQKGKLTKAQEKLPQELKDAIASGIRD